MNKMYLFIMMTAIAALSAAPAFSQDKAQAPAAIAAEAKAPATVAPISKEIAIYGEVQSVNASAASLSIQYYDYDTDSEKTTEIISGKDTKLENVKAIGEVKKGDWLDVTYIVSDGKNIAKMISVEKDEPEGSAAPGTMTDVPSVGD